MLYILPLLTRGYVQSLRDIQDTGFLQSSMEESPKQYREFMMSCSKTKPSPPLPIVKDQCSDQCSCDATKDGAPCTCIVTIFVCIEKKQRAIFESKNPSSAQAQFVSSFLCSFYAVLVRLIRLHSNQKVNWETRVIFEAKCRTWCSNEITHLIWHSLWQSWSNKIAFYQRQETTRTTHARKTAKKAFERRRRRRIELARCPIQHEIYARAERALLANATKPRTRSRTASCVGNYENTTLTLINAESAARTTANKRDIRRTESVARMWSLEVFNCRVFAVA